MISEHKEQVAIFEWATLNMDRYPQLELMFAIPNGSQRNRRTGQILKREGVKAGVPDICLPYPASSYHGLFIELKRRDGGSPSIKQMEWIVKLSGAGYLATICHGAKEAVELIINYLEGNT